MQEESDDNLCAVCISDLSLSVNFSLPKCGHTFHALCLASALRQARLCPICRVEVAASVCQDIAAVLVPERGRGNTGATDPTTIAEVLVGLECDGTDGVSTEVTVDALRLITQDRDASKLRFVASVIGRAGAQPLHQPEVRLAALAAVQAILGEPCLSDDVASLGQQILRQCCAYDKDREVRRAAISAMQDLCAPGDSEAILAVQQVLEEHNTDPQLKLQAVTCLEHLSTYGNIWAIRAALAALKNSDQDSGVQHAAFGILRSNCREGESIEILDDMSELVRTHPDPRIRQWALELLSSIEVRGGGQGIAIATFALKDVNTEVRNAALHACCSLWKPGDPEAVTLLGNLSRPPNDPACRRMAIEALEQVAEHQDPQAIQITTAALCDSYGSVRGAARHAIRSLS